MMIARLSNLTRRWVLPLISVIGTGLVGAICIALMTSGKVSFVSADAAARLAIFIAFQVLGVTLVKAGLDSYVFARAATEQAGALYNLRSVFRTTLLRAWIVFSIGSYFVLGSWLGAVICSVSVLCDVYAAVRTAEFTARKHFRIVALANMAKYPLYFLLLFIVGPFLAIGYNDLLYLFLFVSLLRSLVLFVISARFTLELVPAYSFGLLGAQQVFNYLLFRLDQVSIPFLSRSIPTLDATSLSNFVFLTKYPELVSYFAAALGSIVFPKLMVHWGSNCDDYRRERWLTNIGLFFLCGFGLLFYVMALHGGLDIVFVFLPLVLAACLSFEVNFLTFRMLATNSFRHLLIGLVVGVFFGMITGIFAGVTQSVILIYWIVPVQLFIFLVVYNLVEQT
jgi:hypothetical protein